MSTFIPAPYVDTNISSRSDANNVTIYTVPAGCYAEVGLTIPSPGVVYLNYPSGPSFGSGSYKITIGPGTAIYQQTSSGQYVSIYGVQFRNG